MQQFFKVCRVCACTRCHRIRRAFRHERRPPAAGLCRNIPALVTRAGADDVVTGMIETLRKVIQRLHYPIEVMLVCVRWYSAYPLSLRHIEEMRAERGVFVDHATVHRWSIKILPVLAAVFRRRKRPVGISWRMDETYIEVGGQWKCLYRAVDRPGATIDLFASGPPKLRCGASLLRTRHRCTRRPRAITADKSGANTAAIEGMRADSGADIQPRQSKYLNNIVEQDHRAIKRIVRPMLGFKSSRCASILIAGIESMHMIKKGQLDRPKAQASSADDRF